MEGWFKTLERVLEKQFQQFVGGIDLETNKDYIQLAKMGLQNAIYIKKSYLQEKNEKNANNSQELWKAINTSFKMKSGKVNQSKIALWKDGAIQFEPIKNANNFKDFYSDLARNIVRKLPVALSKFNNNLMKQYQLH